MKDKKVEIIKGKHKGLQGVAKSNPGQNGNVAVRWDIGNMWSVNINSLKVIDEEPSAPDGYVVALLDPRDEHGEVILENYVKCCSLEEAKERAKYHEKRIAGGKTRIAEIRFLEKDNE